MYSHLIFEHILPNLSPKQIDELQCCNPKLRDYIIRNRLDLPRTVAHSVHIHSHKYGYKFNCEFKEEKGKRLKTRYGHQIEMESYYKFEHYGNGIMKFLRNIKVETLTLQGDYICASLDQKWMQTVNTICIKDASNWDACSTLLSNLNCSSIGFHSCHFDIIADGVLDTMPFVKSLRLDRAVCSSTFFDKLTQKSKLGSGLEMVAIRNLRHSSVGLNNFIDFLKNALFSNMSTIIISHISCSVEEFHAELKVLEESGERISLNEEYENCYTINSPTSIISINLINFTG